MEREQLEQMTPQQLLAAHAAIDKQIEELRGHQGNIHEALTAKEDAIARAASAGRVQNIGRPQ